MRRNAIQCTQRQVSADPGAGLNRKNQQGFFKTESGPPPTYQSSQTACKGKCKCCGRRCCRRRGPSTRVKNVSSTVTQSIPTVTRRLRLITRDRALVAIVNGCVSRGPSPNVVTCRNDVSMLMFVKQISKSVVIQVQSVYFAYVVTSRRTSSSM